MSSPILCSERMRRKKMEPVEMPATLMNCSKEELIYMIDRQVNTFGPIAEMLMKMDLAVFECRRAEAKSPSP